MKLLKKMSALLVAVVMMAVTVVPALAEGVTSAPQDPESTITVSIPNHTFVAYQIFKGDAIREDVIVGETTTDTGVLSNIDWGDGINPSAFVMKLMETFPDWELTDNSTPTEVANKFSGLSVADANKVAQIAFENKTTKKYLLKNPGNTSVRQGYYLIVDTTQDLTNGDALNPAILAVNGDVTVKEKKKDVTVDKTVKNETDSTFAGSTDSSIGKKVTFKLHTQIINEEALANYESYFLEFSDSASNALDPVVDANTKKVIFNAYLSNDDTLVTDGDGADTNITSWFEASTVTGTGTNDRTFTFTDTDIKNNTKDPNYAAGKHIFITYEATLNNNAVIGSDGNLNEVVVNYSNNPNWSGTGEPIHGTTEKDEAIVFTFKLDGTKVAKEDDNIQLNGAEFVVYRMKEGSKEYAVMDENKKITGWEILSDEDLNSKIATNAEGRENYLLISKINGDNKGQFGIQGLGDGIYFLQETKAPDGYNLITSAIKFEIASTQENKKLESVSININEGTPAPGIPSTGTVTTTVENTKGTTLPETGGMGTTMLYVAGGILLIGSAVLLVTKKRMGHEN